MCLSGCSSPTRHAGATHDCREITARTFRVLRVIDGDTFTIRYDGEETSVRIADIDAPEPRKPGGPAARDAMAELIDRRVVLIDFTERSKRDSFGRLLCRVTVDDVDVALCGATRRTQSCAAIQAGTVATNLPCLGRTRGFP